MDTAFCNFNTERFRKRDTPADPDDAAEERAWLTASEAIEDCEAAELDLMQGPFAGERDGLMNDDAARYHIEKREFKEHADTTQDPFADEREDDEHSDGKQDPFAGRQSAA